MDKDDVTIMMFFITLLLVGFAFYIVFSISMVMR
jgi:hypothetical protein